MYAMRMTTSTATPAMLSRDASAYVVTPYPFAASAATVQSAM